MIVAPLDREHIHAVYQFRLGLDPLATALAAQRATAAAVKEGRRILEAQKKALAVGSVPVSETTILGAWSAYFAGSPGAWNDTRTSPTGTSVAVYVPSS